MTTGEERAEPRIVESGPIHINVSMSQVVQLALVDPEFKAALEAFLKDWVVKKLREDAAEAPEGAGED